MGAWVGGGGKTMTDGRIKQIESAMIAEFKPRLNGVGVKKYTGSKKLEIESNCLQDENWDVLNWIIYFDD